MTAPNVAQPCHRPTPVKGDEVQDSDSIEAEIRLFVSDLAALRISSGAPSYRTLARRANLPRSTVYDVLTRPNLPTIEQTTAVTGALGADVTAWKQRWAELRARLDDAESPVRAAPADDPSEPGRARPWGWVRRRPLVTAGVVVALLVAGGLVVLAATSCREASVYRVTAAGRVLDGDGVRVGSVGAGQEVLVRSTTHDVYEHRYYAEVIGSDDEGYLDESKLDFVRDTCA